MRRRSVSRSDSDLAMRASDVLDDNAKLGVNSMDGDDVQLKKKPGFFQKVFGRNKNPHGFHTMRSPPTSGSSSGKGKEKSDQAGPVAAAVEGGDAFISDEEEVFDEVTAKLKAESRSKTMESIPVSSFDDLPEQFRDSIRQAGIDENELRNNPANFFAALSCMHFFSKQPFIFHIPGEKDPRDLSKMRALKNDFSKLPPLEQMVSSPITLKKEYKVNNGEKVGQGGFGKVYAGKKLKNPSKGKVAVKKMPHTTEKERNNNFHEIYFLKKLNHPNIVRYDASYIVENEVWLMMEFMEGGTLKQACRLHAFTEEQIAYVAFEMLQGIKYLHSLSLVHRDLKSENVMMTVQGDVKLIDFGLCFEATPELLSNNKLEGMVGSPCWIPPEMIHKKPYGANVDIWSFGICIVELAEGQAPNQSLGGLKAMYVNATAGHPQPFAKPEKWSPQFKDFIAQALTIDPKKRPSAEEMLAHPFLRKRDDRRCMKKILSFIFLQTEIQNVGF